jgi:hypothetical protein
MCYTYYAIENVYAYKLSGIFLWHILKLMGKLEHSYIKSPHKLEQWMSYFVLLSLNSYDSLFSVAYDFCIAEFQPGLRVVRKKKSQWGSRVPVLSNPTLKLLNNSQKIYLALELHCSLYFKKSKIILVSFKKLDVVNDISYKGCKL